ncbi:DUF2512 family protein [Gracilibacillus kekensis]|uniref:4 TMS phage holin, superfamily IV n=1 Tax=Gracilibacillus kekensis TaxID=1027249 RepID=A0A1M7QCY2_9BACI|nr:Protein of unknown function [Gracilibacillus kekensis]
MLSLLIKTVSIPIVLFIAIYIWEQVHYEAIWQPVVIVLILITSGLFLEAIILKRKRLWVSVCLDFIATFLILYIISNMFEGSFISLIASIVIAVILVIPEYFLHRFLIKKE